MWRKVLALLFALGVAAQQDASSRDLEQFHVVYEWYKLDYVWPDDATKARALASRRYVPENNALSGVKSYRDRLYLTVPRYRDGIPATLVSLASVSRDRNASPKLEAFPSWEMNEVGNCSALQFVQNIEIDSEGRMWVLDTGRVNIMGRSDPKCPPKLVILQLADTNNTRVIRTVQFPGSVVDGLTSYLVDLVLDPTDGWHAYISDASDADPGIVVYSFLEDRAWKVRDPRTMKADPSARKFSVSGRPTEILQNVSPLGLDLRRSMLYYSPLSSLDLFALPTAVLKDEARASEAPHSTRDVGKKLGLSEGFAMDQRGVLYYGLIDDNGIAKWDTNMSFQDNQHVISKDPVRLQWPTNFGFDEVGNLWLVSNRMHNYIAGRVNLSEANYRVIRGLTGTKSYLYTEGDDWGSKPSPTPSPAPNNTSRYDSRSGGSWTTVTPLALLAVIATTLA